ncbi:META domain-containing protein [Winogradskyella vidalii]|uniref:META domain-containing protein n=1 Tax=Winogradskyella vidalii TaxID=2615024 RepID=UPI0015CD8E92|nr:META domain-containing protein [Winogradskyella vidalii]
MKTKLTTLVIIALTMVSCNNQKKSTSETENQNVEVATEKSNLYTYTSIENTRWVITKLRGTDMVGPEANGQAIYFVLDAETNRVNGNSGCNTFMGTYTIVEGNQISFSKLGSTQMLCPDSKINESQILNVFENADNFSLSGDKLTLNKAKMAPLAEFKKVEMESTPIVDTRWNLKSIEGQEVPKAENEDGALYFTLNSADNRITGFAGCNSFGGNYTLEADNNINFSGMLSTLKACPNVDFNEAKFLKAFELAKQYTITDNELLLSTSENKTLAVFEMIDMK